MATSDLAEILGTISQYIKGIGQDKQTTQGMIDDNEKLRQQGVEALKTAATLEEDLAKTDLQQKLEMESRKKATAQTFGVDILDPNNRIAMLAREQAAAIDESLARSSRANELLDLNYFDNPLEYMAIRPFAGRHQEAAARSATKAQLLDKAITDLNQQAQATVQTQAAITTELTNDEAAKRAELARLKADEAVRVASVNRNNAYLEDLQRLRSLDGEAIKWNAEAYKLKRHEQEFNARMAEMAAARKERAEKKKQEKDDLNYLMMRYNLGAELVGRPKSINQTDFQNLIKYNKNHVVELANLGESVWVDPANPVKTVGQIAPTPGNAQVTLEYFQGKLPASAERTAKYLQAESSLAKQSLQAETKGKITQDMIAERINSQVVGKAVTKDGKSVVVPGSARTMYEDVETNPNGMTKNIYRAPDVNVMTSAIPGLTKLPGYKEILVPASVASGPSPTVQSMIDQAKLSISEGKLKPEQAAQFIASYYGNALDVNNTNEQYLKVGLGTPKQYNVKIKTGYGTFTANIEQLDATNYQKVLKSLMVKEPASLFMPEMFR